MNATTPSRENKPRELVLLLGSNIDPITNLNAALDILSKDYGITRKSSVWETLPVGSQGPHFLNQAVGIITHLPLEEMRYQQLRQIEASLGRKRGADKNAPRTIDIDVILDSCQIIDEKIWQYAFVCVPVAQLEPELVNPVTGQSLSERVKEILLNEWVIEKSL